MAKAKTPTTRKQKESIITQPTPVVATAETVQAAPVPTTTVPAVSIPAVSQPQPKTPKVAKVESRKNLVPINLDDEIRRRAYELYLQRGRSSGHANEDWLVAEHEVMQRYHQQSA